ncbi:hypothetical protein VTK73DRAFT_812 [Phialemonium thermophilum]|uniref:Major facilitator superfamily (MFS) profile domain-containing protein n=1 Tax=Phialemonium thermophilum TaxID=223376 RepID=A0ABR3XCF0_9PEZI
MDVAPEERVVDHDARRRDAELGTAEKSAQDSGNEVGDTMDWDDEPRNPRNWPVGQKFFHVGMLSSTALLPSIGTSIGSPAHAQFMSEFHVGSTVAILPLTLYVLALGFGPVVGGPLSETVGRRPVYIGSVAAGALFTLGAGFTHSFAGLCVLRFLAGFCWGPILAVASGSISDVFLPAHRGPVSAFFVLVPFLGPGLGPVIGSFVVNRKGWRWTQWTLLFLALLSLVMLLFAGETFHPTIRRRLAKVHRQQLPPSPPWRETIRTFVIVSLVRPCRMLLFDPVVGFICLYVAVDFGTLFSFFAAVPYTFGRVYRFSLEQSGLVFVSITIGCMLGLLTVLLCDLFLYRRQVPRYPPHKVPPEHRLYPAMIGSIGLPCGLFWFAWTARSDISWASPAAGIVPFAWGNICVFVSTIQYLTDTYHGTVVASASSANSLARYGFAGVFPLFTIQMFETLGINWAGSLLGFVSIALMPIPWVLFRYGARIRARSDSGPSQESRWMLNQRAGSA